MRRYCCIIGVWPIGSAAFIGARALPCVTALRRRLVGGAARDVRVRREQLDELPVDLRAAGDDLALVQELGLAGEVADESPGLGNDQRAGGHVPGGEPGLEERVVPAGRDVAEVERG